MATRADLGTDPSVGEAMTRRVLTAIGVYVLAAILGWGLVAVMIAMWWGGR